MGSVIPTEQRERRDVRLVLTTFVAEILRSFELGWYIN
jgi:hypothetical protein